VEGTPGGFLPPEPPGPEPELGEAPSQPPPPPQQTLPPPQSPYPAYGWAQPPPPGWGYAPQPAAPDNGAAVAGFVLSLVAGGLLLISFGLSSIISVACAIFGLVYSRKGKRRVQAGETPKHGGLAQAGFIISIVSLVLAVIATLAYVALIIAYATDEEFRHDLESGFDDKHAVAVTVRLAGAAGRALLG
jgi:hypothetical protein